MRHIWQQLNNLKPALPTARNGYCSCIRKNWLIYLPICLRLQGRVCVFKYPSVYLPDSWLNGNQNLDIVECIERMCVTAGWLVSSMAGSYQPALPVFLAILRWNKLLISCYVVRASSISQLVPLWMKKRREKQKEQAYDLWCTEKDVRQGEQLRTYIGGENGGEEGDEKKRNRSQFQLVIMKTHTEGRI